MQAETNDIIFHKALESVLVPGSFLKKMRESDDIIARAESRARKIVKDAVRESESIRKESYRTGYERGLLMSVDSVCQYIDNSVQYAEELYLKVESDIKKLLTELFDQENVLLKIVDEWIDTLDKKNDDLPLYILMPYANRRFKVNLTEAIKNKHQGSVVFQYHQEPRFVFKYKEHLAEFYPEEYIASTVKSLMDNRDFYYDSQKISAEAIQGLHQRIALYYQPVDKVNNFTENTWEGLTDGSN
ncbi:hypothetical protein AAGR22_20870 [Erwinia sp. HDF1-3R]|uniref:hypothetical protein n=1 Tax=Erwinia sp. HDF1-3R TaxID=3141543 RepID=UPI0031F4F50A